MKEVQTMKQYVVEEAYTGNDKVSKYVDGKCVGWDVMSNYNTTGYCNALKSEGYEEAFDLEAFQKRVEEAKESYEDALKAYERAKKSPLLKNNK